MAKAVNSRVGRGCATALGCDYQGHEFGAQYPDSVCIDGYLWDADSDLTIGGDMPCPQCNHAAWRDYYAEAYFDDGYERAANYKWPIRKSRYRRDWIWAGWQQLRGAIAYYLDAIVDRWTRLWIVEGRSDE